MGLIDRLITALNPRLQSEAAAAEREQLAIARRVEDSEARTQRIHALNARLRADRRENHYAANMLAALTKRSRP